MDADDFLEDHQEPLEIEDFEVIYVLHAAAIGRLTMGFSHLEILMKFFVSHLIGDFRTGQLVTAGLRVQALSELALAITAERYEITSERYLDLKDAVESVNKARISRNNIVHAAWTVEGEGSDQEHVRTTLKLKKQTVAIDQRPFNMEAVQDALEQITDASDLILRFMFIEYPDFAPESPFDQTD